MNETFKEIRAVKNGKPARVYTVLKRHIAANPDPEAPRFTAYYCRLNSSTGFRFLTGRLFEMGNFSTQADALLAVYKSMDAAGLKENEASLACH